MSTPLSSPSAEPRSAKSGASSETTPPAPIRGRRKLLKRAFLHSLEGLKEGELCVVDQEGERCFGVLSPAFPIRGRIEVHDARFYEDCAMGGSIGAAESYMNGRWSTPDLTAVIRILSVNRETLEGMEGGLARIVRAIWKWSHKLRRNTREGSRKNIAAHYDLSNDFFRLFLDESMMYSCAIFETRHDTLEQASWNKVDRICRKLRLTPSDHLLEIGTGWGTMAIHAARHYGCKVTTTTISKAQHELASQRVRQEGLEDRITILLKDYRDLTGTYDKLVSVEMIEAVGHQYFGTFFQKCSELLTPEGAMLLQAITIADQNYEQARKSVDFIQHFIFPGSCIPSNQVIADCVARNTDLRIFHVEDITPHYAETLRHWRQRFLRNQDKVRELGFSDEFQRMWDFYLCYCEGGFEERVIGDVQVLMTKPRNRQPALVPSLSEPSRESLSA